MAAGVVASLMLAACSSGGSAGPSGSPTAEPALGPVSSVTKMQEVVRPIDSYLPSTEEVLKLVTTSADRINACLISRGLNVGYSPAEDPSRVRQFVAGLASDNIVRNDLWGFFDTDSARVLSHGYQRAEADSGTMTTTMSEGSHEAVAKCKAQANAPLPGGADTEPEFLVDIRSLPARGPEVPLADSRWLAAQAKWSKCMATAGFANYKTPLDAISDPKWRPQLNASGGPAGAGATSEQIATATADISCKQKTNLVGVGLAVQSAYDQRYIQENAHALADFRAKIDAYVAGE